MEADPEPRDIARQHVEVPYDPAAYAEQIFALVEEQEAELDGVVEERTPAGFPPDNLWDIEKWLEQPDSRLTSLFGFNNSSPPIWIVRRSMPRLQPYRSWRRS